MMRALIQRLQTPAISIALRLPEGNVNVRRVRRVGETFRVRAYVNLPYTEMRVLPHGKVSGGPSFVLGWDPVAPIDWQPDGAETANEKVQRLEAENRVLSAQLEQATSRLKRIAETALQSGPLERQMHRSAKLGG